MFQCGGFIKAILIIYFHQFNFKGFLTISQLVDTSLHRADSIRTQLPVIQLQKSTVPLRSYLFIIYISKFPFLEFSDNFPMGLRHGESENSRRLRENADAGNLILITSILHYDSHTKFHQISFIVIQKLC